MAREKTTTKSSAMAATKHDKRATALAAKARYGETSMMADMAWRNEAAVEQTRHGNNGGIRRRANNEGVAYVDHRLT